MTIQGGLGEFNERWEKKQARVTSWATACPSSGSA
jgi:hypothetical protein